MKQKQSLSVTKFKNALISGYHSIYNQRYYLNSINVFPVPDGDTGSNLNYTVKLGIEKIINQQFSSLKTLFLSFNQGLLLGARGNSGVIFSEIFRGFCMGIPQDNKLLNNNILLDCFANAKIIAYQAVIKPVEGTMLTIIRCIATMLRRFREKINSWSLVKTFTKIIVNCEETLFQTSGTSATNNVVKNVDAGAFALKVFFEGMLIYFRSNVIVRKLSSEELKKYHFVGKKQTATAFGFCTALTVKMFDQGQRKLLTKKLTTTTINSLVVAGDDVMCKVHGHTTRPGTMLDILQDHGELLQIKIDNMSLQHQTAINHTNLSECEAHVVVKKVLTPQEILLITENSQLFDYFNKEFQVKHQLVLDQKQPLTWSCLRKKISTIQTKQLLIISSQNESNSMTIPSARANTVLPNLKWIVNKHGVAGQFLALVHYLKEEAPGKNLKRINKVLKSALCLIVNRSSKRQWQLLRGSKVLSHAPTLKEFLPLFQATITTLLKKRDIEIMNIFYRNGVAHSIKEWLKKQSAEMEINLINAGATKNYLVIVLE